MIEEILIFIVVLALAIKGTVDFIDWAKTKVKKRFKSEQIKTNQSFQIEKRLVGCDSQIEKIVTTLVEIEGKINYITDCIDLLNDCNRDAIKSYIVQEHRHFFNSEHWIDTYSLDCLEKRYIHYKKLGGNSFVHELMEELRELPKSPPQK